MTIIGYTDSVSVASWDTLALKGSTRKTRRFDARLVLLHTAGGTRHPGRLASERGLPRGLLAFERGLPREGAADSNGVIGPIESPPRLAERRLSLWLHMSTVSNPAALLVWDADNVVFLGSDAIAEVRLGGQSFKAEKTLDLRYWYKLTACFVAGTREFVLRVEDARWYRKAEEVRQPYDGKPPSSGGSELLTTGCAGRLSAQLAIPPPRLWTTRRSCRRQPPQSTGRSPCVDRPTRRTPTGAHPSNPGNVARQDRSRRSPNWICPASGLVCAVGWDGARVTRPPNRRFTRRASRGMPWRLDARNSRSAPYEFA